MSDALAPGTKVLLTRPLPPEWGDGQMVMCGEALPSGSIKTDGSDYCPQSVWEATGWTVTVVAPPRPAWADTPGEVVRDRDGDVWVRSIAGWVLGREPLTYDDLLADYGPLTRLVPEVQA